MNANPKTTTAPRIVQALLNGVRVGTPMGEGTVYQVALFLNEWPDGSKSLSPPVVIVRLDMPWQGETHVTVALTDVTIKGANVFSDVLREMWPGQAVPEADQTIRPTNKPDGPLKLSEMVRALSLDDLVDKPKETESSPEKEQDISVDENELEGGPESGPYSSEDYSYFFDYPIRDPNGPSHWTQTFYRPPFSQRVWRISELIRKR